MLSSYLNGAQTWTRWTDNPQKRVRVSVHWCYATVGVGLDQDKQLLAQTLVWCQQNTAEEKGAIKGAAVQPQTIWKMTFIFISCINFKSPHQSTQIWSGACMMFKLHASFICCVSIKAQMHRLKMCIKPGAYKHNYGQWEEDINK